MIDLLLLCLQLANWPQSTSDAIQRLNLSLTDLSRSLELSHAVVREVSDEKIARKRFIEAISQTSHILNLCLEHNKRKTISGETLDEARNHAWSIDLENSQPQLNDILTQVNEELRDIFIANFIYEALLRTEAHLGWNESDLNWKNIVRHIEFEPEYLQAGVLILNQFGRIIKEKAADQSVKVRILQNDTSVTLIIESMDGQVESVEKTLADIQAMINGEKRIDEIIDDEWLLLKTQQALDFAKMQLSHEQQKTKFFMGANKHLRSENEMYLKLIGTISDRISSDNHYLATIENQNDELRKLIEVFQKSTQPNAKRMIHVLEKDTLTTSDKEFMKDFTNQMEVKSPESKKQLRQVLIEQGISGMASGAIGYLAKLILGG